MAYIECIITRYRVLWNFFCPTRGGLTAIVHVACPSKDCLFVSKMDAIIEDY